MTESECRDAEDWHARATDALARRRPAEAEQAARRAIALDPRAAAYHVSLARSLNNQQRLPEALTVLREAVRLNPDDGFARCCLGHVARRLGSLDVAAEAYRAAAELAPDDPRAHRGLGEVCYARGDHSAAAASLRRALELAPGDLDALYNFGLACHAEGELEQAVAAFRDVLARDARHLDALTNLASAYRTLGAIDDAEAAFRRALTIDARHPPALAGLAALLDLTGRTTEGIELLEARAPGADAAADIVLCRAELLRHAGRAREAQASFERLAARDDLSPPQRTVLEFSLCGILDALGQYDCAFRHAAAANQSMPVRFDSAARRNAVDELIAIFSREAMAALPRSSNRSSLPVFIVGMPRSGTSLVEQIVASHPAVFGAGELRDIGRATRGLGARLGAPWPDCVPRLTRELLDEQSGAYLSRLADLGAGAARVTDKMWQNFENLGLIELLLTRARVIHCQREPLDTGLSCYFQSFALIGPPFSYGLAHIGAYYREYLRLMRHWRQVSTLELLEIRYEDLVEDPEAHSRRLIEFLDLPWDPACLDFHRNPRIVRTASSRQVREPVFGRSVNRHRHYARFLDPLREALEA
ncbi:tetratricopeptide repeat protein [soil metagenome]